jgi:hypothetical protein
VLLVHAVNPYGFSHIRRVTENNVDLNRNFRDFSKPPPENPRYAEIHELLVPADWDGPARADATLKVWLQANGMPACQAAVAGGQYAFPNGLFFGGQRPTWSNATFRAILRSHGAAARRVGEIDIVGPTGYGEPISVIAPGAPEFERARAWCGDEVTSVTDGTSKSPPVTGSLIGAIEESLPHAETTSIGLEFGTVPLADVLEAIRGGNWLYARGLRSGLSMESHPRATSGESLRPRRRFCLEGLSRPGGLTYPNRGSGVLHSACPSLGFLRARGRVQIGFKV